ncbi:Pescadillo-like protein [Bienertia sinuspersici]
MSTGETNNNNNNNSGGNIDVTSALYLHPSETTLILDGKLQGNINYRSWKRQMELALVTRRKLGFVTGVVERDADNKKKQNFAIKKSIIYYTSIRELWVHLERRFIVSNGVLKYKINRQLYVTQQNGQSINEYYTRLYSLWKDLDDLNHLPHVTQYTIETRAFLDAVKKLTNEQHLFQFFMGLDDEYGPQKSQLLLQSPLPSVETAYS